MSEKERANKEIVKKGYEAFAAGDIEAIRNLFDDDIEWVQPGDSVISGTYHGRREVLDYIGRLAERSLKAKVKDLVAEGDTVVALTEVAIGAERGQDADVFTLRDGKVVRVHANGDTALLERVWGSKKHAAAQ